MSRSPSKRRADGRRMTDPTTTNEVRRGNWLLLVVAGGVFIAADDQTSVVTVLPSMLRDAGITVDDFYRASWIINAYLLGYIVALPIVGRVADVFGHARVYAASLAVFIVGSMLVASAPGFAWLISARALQAVGGGAVVPVAMAIVVGELPPSKRVLGLGAIAAASEAGALIGPLWGGAITEAWGWRWVFWVNVPMAIPFLWGAWRYAGREVRSGAIDWPSALLLGAALTILTLALVDDPITPRPLAVTLALLASTVVPAALFVLRQRAAREPMLRLASLAPRAAWSANAVNFLVGGGLITVLIGGPLFVNLVLAQRPLEGGLTLMRFTVAVPLGALAGGWLAHRWSLRGTAFLGMALAATCFGGLQAWDRTLTEVLRTLPQLVGGFGFGLVIAPLSAAVLHGVAERERATAASWLTLSRMVGMLVGTSLLTSHGLGRFYARASGVEFGSPEFGVLVAQAQVVTFREVFIVAGAVMVVGSLLALLLGRGRAEDEAGPWWAVG
ncbi:MAG: MFS transporter [Dehalococcoidia bacterium]|nr:MFS transporter [Dehalococcoidia bacterium]